MSDEKPESDRYWLLIGPVPTGPFSLVEIGRLPSNQVTSETQVCRVGESGWRPLREVAGPRPTNDAVRETGMAPAATRPAPSKTNSGSSTTGWFQGGGFAILMFLVAIGKVLRGCNADTTKAPVKRVEVQHDRRFDDRRVNAASIPMDARISISASDGTRALQALVAGLPDEQIALLNLRVVLTGTDTYGAYVRIRNSGAVSVRIFPGNFRVCFGPNSTLVTTADHPGFLRECMIAPGESTEGLVMYQATIDAGAAIRFAGTTFLYDDSSITVDYR